MLNIYNTLTKKIQIFKPINPDQVTMYSCGPTVYDYVHVGNLRTFILSDILKRTLLLNNYKVNHVINITDVGHLTNDENDTGEDKMEKGSAREGKTAFEIAAFYTQAFKSDFSELNMIDPNKWAVATEHIQEQVSQVKKLIDLGFTYQTPDGIYFDTTENPNYGDLINLKNQKLKTGARVDMGDKKNPHDFALWKFSNQNEKRQMEWQTELGAEPHETRAGFPGWHIECSAMSMKYLGDHFDIHTGGIDLSRVHHINEIAQAESITGKEPWVNYWVHGEFLLMEDTKMSKSLGNLVTLQTLKDKNINALSYRFYTLQAHYRKQLNFTWEALEAAQEGLKRLKNAISKLEDSSDSGENKEFRNLFLEKINSDLNMPEAVALLWKHVKEDNLSKQDVKFADNIFGLGLLDNNFDKPAKQISPEIQDLLSQRKIAREIKNFELSDKLRDQISELGFTVKDGQEGQTIE